MDGDDENLFLFPFLQGREDYYTGQPNPYPKDSEEHKAWWRGWRCSDWREEARLEGP